MWKEKPRQSQGKKKDARYPVPLSLDSFLKELWVATASISQVAYGNRAYCERGRSLS